MAYCINTDDFDTITVACDSADTAPCSSASGTVDLSAWTITGCDTIDEYYVISYNTNAFSDISIAGAVVTYTPSDDAVAGKLYSIKLGAKCTGTDENEYRAEGVVKICLQDLCDGVSCLDTEYCDKCDGTCNSKEIDLVATDNNPVEI